MDSCLCKKETCPDKLNDVHRWPDSTCLDCIRIGLEIFPEIKNIQRRYKELTVLIYRKDFEDIING